MLSITFMSLPVSTEICMRDTSYSLAIESLKH